jgi:hypothetical protein
MQRDAASRPAPGRLLNAPRPRCGPQPQLAVAKQISTIREDQRRPIDGLYLLLGRR